MTFEDVKNDIVKLIGLDLESVRPGAGIRILNVDLKQGNLQLKTVSGQVRSRPLLELERIWNELQKSPAVHVDQVLKGSGTSRNQPETILANLPYIEWAKIHNKKHLIFVKEKTHPYGTLKQMDRASSAVISAQVDDLQSSDDISVVVVTADIKSSIDFFQNICGGVVTAKEQGVYLLETNTNLIAFISPALTGLETGTYPIVEANYTVYKNNSIIVLGEELVPINTSTVKVLIRQK
ncbi:MAG: hypothetical protein SPH10_04065 [Candidatus Cryptobacteroides sp.]|nr:hypothetical protein [Candidatus Cryptobacteroides sp.]